MNRKGIKGTFYFHPILNEKHPKIKFFICMVGVILLLASHALSSQTISNPSNEQYTSNYQFFSTKDGLSSNDIRRVICDTKGFIWIATINGLNRFDGKKFKHFTKEQNGLFGNDIHWILEDGKERLWVRSYHEGIFKIDLIDLNTLEVHPLDAYIENLPESLGFTDYGNGRMYISDRTKIGQIYTVTDDLKFELFYNGTVQNDRVQVSPLGQALLTQNLFHVPKTILLDAQGNVQGEYPFMIEHVRPLSDKSEVISRRYERDSIYFLKDGRLTNPRTLPFKSDISDDKILVAKYDSRSSRYLILTDKQVLVYDDSWNLIGAFRDQIHKNYPGIILHEPCFDQQGNVWFSTVRRGIVYIKVEKKTFRISSQFLLDKDFETRFLNLGNKIPVTKEQSWIAHRSIYSYEKESQEIINWFPQKPFKNIASVSNEANDLCVLFENEIDKKLSIAIYDSRGNLTSEILTIDKTRGELKAFKLFLDSKRRCWIGTEKEGLYYVDFRDKQFKTLPETEVYLELSTDGIKSFAENEKGIWLIGMKTGLYLYQDGKGLTKKYGDDKDMQGAVFNRLQDLAFDKEGNIWLTSAGLGVGKLDLEKNTVDRITTEDGLATNINHQILFDVNGYLWVTSKEGLIRINPESKSIRQINFNEQGFKTIYDDAKKLTSDGQLFFSSYYGMLSFYPYLYQDTTSASLLVSGVEYLNSNTGLFEDFTTNYLKDRKLVMKPHQTALGLNIALIDYQEPEEHTYQYKIEGLNDDWMNTYDSRILLAGLPYGDYNLQIKAFNEYGQSAHKNLNIPLKLRKPIYLESWFIFLSILILIGLIYAFIRWRTANFKIRQKILEESIEEATQTIREQNEELKNLDQVKSRFFANVSHELRTPLTLMLGPIDSALKGKNLTPRDQTFLRLAQESGEKLHDLINEILDLTKLEKGKLELNESPTVLYVFIRRLLAAFESHAEKKKISFEFSYQPDQYLQLKLDQNKFEKILNNLISNALKYTPEGGMVSIQINELPNKVQMEVRDTGIGIHPNDLAYVFDRFYQSKRPEAAAAGGTGIGLALSMEFAKLMKGDLWVESELGKGSCFVFEFPKREVLKSIPASDAKEILKPEIVLEKKWDQKEVKTKPIVEKEGKQTILVVEDNPNLREYIQTILGDHWNVRTAENGKVALDLLGWEDGNTASKLTFLPDLILSDLMMPVMDGYQLLNTLKTSDHYRSLPFIMLTARAEMEDKLQALRFGVDDYMMKPFAEEELLIRIENLLKNSKERRLAILPEEEQEESAGSVEHHSDISEEEMEWLKRLEQVAIEHAGNFSLNADFLATQMFTSRVQLFRVVKKLTGYTLTQYIQGIRLQQARRLLETREVNSVKAAALSVGYKQVDKFSQNFKKHFGRLPSSYL